MLTNADKSALFFNKFISWKAIFVKVLFYPKLHWFWSDWFYLNQDTWQKLEKSEVILTNQLCLQCMAQIL